MAISFHFTKVHVFSKQFFAHSSIDTIWWYLLLIFELISADTKLFQSNIVQNIVLKINALYQFISWPSFSIFDATVIHNLGRVPNWPRISEGYHLNSLWTISYLGVIWELNALSLKSKDFCKNKNQILVENTQNTPTFFGQICLPKLKSCGLLKGSNCKLIKSWGFQIEKSNFINALLSANGA